MNAHVFSPGRLPLLLSALAATFLAGAAAWRSSELAASAPDDRQRLAAHLGVAAERLTDLIAVEERLLDGSRLTTLKAVDAAAGEVVGASFLNERAVDRRQAIDAAGAAWRAVNGAITPALLERMGTMSADERVRVDVWYRFDPPESPEAKGADARPRDDAPPPELLARLDAMRTAEAEAIAWAATRDDTKRNGETPLPDAAAADIEAAASSSPAPANEIEKPAGTDAIVVPPDQLTASAAALAAAHERDLAHVAALRASLAPVRGHVLERLQGEGVAILQASDIAPVLSVELDRTQIARLSRWPEIDALYGTPTEEGVALGTAGPALNADLIRGVGYTGTGVTVSVSEWGRVFGENPFLNVAGYCRPAEPGDGHPTAVAGFIASSHDTHRGIAPGATLVSANCADTGDLMDWGAANARVLNHSIWSEGGGSSAFNGHDRRIDWISRFLYDTTVMASGNAGNGCPLQGGYMTNFVTSPGKGYNSVTVGNYDDGNTVAWGNDAMANCSSFGNPTGDGAGGAHEKPELSAPGTALTSTTVSTDPASAVGGVGSGTSYASPMVAGMAANLIQAMPALDNRPEAIKPILMAGALHNIEGSPRLSDVDGAGGMVTTAAVAIVERDHLDYRSLAAADLPLTFYVLAKQGERVRFAIHWQANPNGTYTSDPLPADIDLAAYRGDGTTYVAGSNSVNNPFEIVEFTAPETDLYVFRASLFGSWSGSSTYFGAGWWRGIDRFENGSWYTQLAAPPPLGHHFELRPAEAPPSNYWHGVAVRPDSADYDLQLHSRSWFGDPNGRALLNSSTSGGNGVDFIVVDGNHWPGADSEHYRVYHYAGSGAYQLSAGKHGTLFNSTSDGLFGPYTLNSIQSMFIADIGFDAASMRRIQLIPAGGSNDDLGLALYRSTPGDTGTYHRRRSQSVTGSDGGGAGAVEKIRYGHDGGAFDWLGLVVYNKTYNSDATFYLRVTPSAIFSDGFDGD